jgi:hypothetical protein
MKKIIGMTLSILLWYGLVAGNALAAAWEVPSEFWEKPRSAAAVSLLPPLRVCVEAFLAQPGSRILIHHAGSEESMLQAEELRAWLIALAVEAGRVGLAPDLKPNQNLKIELISLAAGKNRTGQEERK